MATSTWSDLIDSAEKVVGGTYDPLPPGKYEVKVEAAKPKTASTGLEGFETTLVITQGPHANRKLWNNVWHGKDEKQWGRFFKNMDAMGLPETFFRSEPSAEQIAAALVGRTTFVVETQLRNFGGQDRAEVKWINSSTSNGGSPSVGAPGGSTPPPPPPPPVPTAAAGRTAVPPPPPPPAF